MTKNVTNVIVYVSVYGLYDTQSHNSKAEPLSVVTLIFYGKGDRRNPYCNV